MKKIIIETMRKNGDTPWDTLHSTHDTAESAQSEIHDIWDHWTASERQQNIIIASWYEIDDDGDIIWDNDGYPVDGLEIPTTI